MMDGWNMTGWGWTWMGLGTLLTLVVIVLLVRTLTSDSGVRTGLPEEDPALALLRRRFASGEIDEDEFNLRRASLERQV